MATYSAITSAEIDAESPVTDALLGKFRDNPAAMFEGAAGAPRLEFAALGAWYSTAGAVGSYMLASTTSGAVGETVPGGTVAGSSLQPVSIANGGTLNLLSPSLSGTWRCMGYIVNSGGGGLRATLWQRIA